MINQLLEPSQAAAMKLLASADLARAGLADFDKLDIRGSSDAALKRTARDLAQAAKRCASHVTDDATERDARRASDAADGFLRLIEAVEAELASRTDEERQRKLSLHTGDVGEARAPTFDEPYSATDYDAPAPETRALLHGESLRSWGLAQGRGREYAKLSLGGFLRAVATGEPRNEVEERALAGANASSGGVTVPAPVSAAFIDAARAASVVSQAGAVTVPLTSASQTWAKVVTDPTPGWRGENELIAESDPTFAPVTFQPKSCAVMVRVPVELLEDSINLADIIPAVFGGAIAAEVDRVALLGSGLGSEPTGIVNFANLTANAWAGGSIANYDLLVQARTALRAANHDLTAAVMAPREDGVFASLRATDNQPMMRPPALDNVQLLTTSKIPTDGGVGDDEASIICGDFSKLALGMRTDIQLVASRDFAFDRHQVAFAAHVRMDVQALYEEAFTVLSGIVPAT